MLTSFLAASWLIKLLIVYVAGVVIGWVVSIWAVSDGGGDGMAAMALPGLFMASILWPIVLPAWCYLWFTGKLK